MNNNDILKRIRYALNIGNAGMKVIFGLAGHIVTEAEILDMMKSEGEAGYVECGDRVLGLFLDGLIVQRRGRREPSPGTPDVTNVRLTNNLVLKKLRIALGFTDDDIVETLKLAGFEITKSELSALFRKKGHRNYKPCGDQVVKKFLLGLTLRFRK
ncbi:MAG: DUF1456 family protein [Spirochaetes bacterium]|nr:DUF1456 family protein [Spirochaetota bacterium]